MSDPSGYTYLARIAGAGELHLHQPCGGVVADIEAHEGWCGDEHLERRILQAQRKRGVPNPEQRAAKLKAQLRRDLLAELGRDR